MGLATIIRKTRRRQQEMRILVLYPIVWGFLFTFFLSGLDNAGKSTVVSRWLDQPIDQVAPTFGFTIHSLHHPSGVFLNFWDIGGQRSIRAFWRNYFEQTDGLVWVIDSSAPHRLELCRDELFMVLSEQRLLCANLLILANKQDVPGAVGVEEIKRLLGWEQIQERCRCRVIACSALTGENVQEGLGWLVKDISNRLSYDKQ